MLGHLMAIVGLALLCGFWVVVQRWVAGRDPEAPTVESQCGGCATTPHPSDVLDLPAGVSPGNGTCGYLSREQEP